VGDCGGLNMFRGIAAINIDAKGRITVPASQRSILMDESEGKVVLTIDTEDCCLLLYPLTQWLLIEEELSALPSFNPATRRIKRLLIGHATDLLLDKHGRILLPPLLREYAGLEQRIVLVGQGKKFEVWGESQWQMGRDSWLAEDTDDEDGGVPPELMSLSL